MDNKIFSTIEEAENTIASLKAMIQARPEGQAIAVKPTHNEGEVAGIFSKDNLYYTKFMTMSTVKLFENRGLEVFRIEDSVGLYFIVPGTRVRTAARSAVLRIVKIAEPHQDPSHPLAFVQVGDWVYPLMRGSLVYRSEQKYYLFPDLISTTPGSSVGVILSKSCTPETRAQFERLLLGFAELDDFLQQPDSFGKSTDLILGARTSLELIRTNSGVYSQRPSKTNENIVQHDAQLLRTLPNARNCGYGKRIGAGIEAGGELLSRGLQLGAIGTSTALDIGASCLKSTLTKEENDREIPCVIVDGVVYAKATTERVVEISSSILATLSEITSNLAALTACYIKAASAPLVTSLVEASGISPETIDVISSEVKDLGYGISNGASEAYRGLDNAAKILATALKCNTAEVVKHCYGQSAAMVLQTAGDVVGNVAVSGKNAGQVTNPARIVCRTLQKTCLALATAEDST